MKYLIRCSTEAEKQEVFSKECEVLESKNWPWMNLILIESDLSLDAVREIYKNQIVSEYLPDWDNR